MTGKSADYPPTQPIHIVYDIQEILSHLDDLVRSLTDTARDLANCEAEPISKLAPAFTSKIDSYWSVTILESLDMLTKALREYQDQKADIEDTQQIEHLRKILGDLLDDLDL